MARIIKHTSFFKKNHLIIMGGFWFLSGIIGLFLQEKGFVVYLYIPFGLVTILYGYISSKNLEESIQWEKDQITVKEISSGKLIYHLEDIDSIFVSNHHLTIKSGAANGIILDLKDYEEQDIDKLITFISDRSQPVQVA